MNGSWKTTLWGCISGIIVFLIPIIQAGHIDWKYTVGGILLVIGGILQKDNNVTGGNKSNGLTPKS
jgi:hypothetical protein